MSKCSKKCNEIKQKIDSISGLDDDFVYDKLLFVENVVDRAVRIINDYADRNELNGTCFSKKSDIEETRKNIEYWENIMKKALNGNDKYTAMYCRKQINQLRKNIGEIMNE